MAVAVSELAAGLKVDKGEKRRSITLQLGEILKEGSKTNIEVISKVEQNLTKVLSDITRRRITADEDTTRRKKSNKHAGYGGSKIEVIVEGHPYRHEKYHQTVQPVHIAPSTPKWKNNVTDHTFKFIPFNTKSKRFEAPGPHPRLYQKSRQPMKFKATSSSPTQDDHSTLSYTDIVRLLSPSREWKPEGTYRTQTLSVAQAKQKRQQIELERKIGPGAYEVTGGVGCQGHTAAVNKLPHRTTSAPRKWGHLHHNALKKSWVVPGVGSHDVQTPHRPSNVELETMDYGASRWREVKEGSGLPPSLYRMEGSISQLINKTCSLKGPYALFSGKRTDRLKIGTARHPLSLLTATATNPHLGPGRYEIRPPSLAGPFTAIYHEPKQQYKLTPGSMQLTTAHTHRSSSLPGPGAYDANKLQSTCVRKGRAEVETEEKSANVSTKVKAREKRWRESYGFLSSTKREDKVISNFWQNGYEGLSPTTYHVRDSPKQPNAHGSVFASKVDRTLPHKQEALCVKRQRAVSVHRNKRLELARQLNHVHTSKHHNK